MPRALFYRFYDALFAGKDYDREVGLVLGLGWGRDEAAHILEIGAGTGGHTEFFVRRGHRVLGVDTDQEMLALACEKRSRLPPVLTGRLGYFHGNVEDSPDEHYDLAAAMFNVVTYVPDVPGLEGFFGAVSRRLKPGASLVFDAWNGVAALRDPPRDRTTVVETETHRIKADLHCRLDPTSLRAELSYVIEAVCKGDGAPERETHHLEQMLWPPKVIVDVAAGQGLELSALYPMHELSRPATERDWKLLFHCRKT